MTMLRTAFLLPLLLLAPSCVIAVGNTGVAGGELENSGPAASHAICVLRGTEGNEGVTGVVHFMQRSDGVLIEAEVRGLTPGKHGFHVHEWGDVDCGDGVCTGGHYNPTGAKHGGPDSAERHVGDMGNLVANEEGVATYRRVDKHLKLRGPHSVIGRGIIVHAGEDDLESQPTGAAGARLAYGVIGIAEPKD